MPRLPVGLVLGQVVPDVGQDLPLLPAPLVAPRRRRVRGLEVHQLGEGAADVDPEPWHRRRHARRGGEDGAVGSHARLLDVVVGAHGVDGDVVAAKAIQKRNGITRLKEED